MNQRIIYKTAEGGVAVVIPSPNSGLSLDEIIAKDIPPNSEYEIVSVSDVPVDRTFRNAWEKSGRNIVHNMGKCKDIAHARRRKMRAEEFAPLDIEATIPAKAAQAEAAREAIRQKYATMQAQIDSASTPDELKQILGL